jgi:uncharacterized membrane protein
VVDTIKAAFTYATAMLLVLGGLLAIYMSRLDATASDSRVVIAGFVGSAITFLFSSEVQTRTARQAASQTLAAGVASTTNGHG